MCRRECLAGERCEHRWARRASARKVQAAIAEWRARKAAERQEAGMEWRSSAHITRYSA